jgi:hypothetical protein
MAAGSFLEVKRIVVEEQAERERRREREPQVQQKVVKDGFGYRLLRVLVSSAFLNVLPNGATRPGEEKDSGDLGEQYRHWHCVFP